MAKAVSQQPGEVQPGEVQTGEVQPGEAAAASGQAAWWMSADALRVQDAGASLEASRAAPSGPALPFGQDASAPSRWRRSSAVTLGFKTAIAGVSALLLFWAVKVLAPRAGEEASLPPPVPPTAVMGNAGQDGATAAPAPLAPLATPRTPAAVAAPAPSAPPRAAAPGPPNPSRSLCSVADEAAGLCKSRQ
ncbi:hypothetical protein UC35_15075 [Ramlibacter tataouinensis]|uniref:Uncharacterized protein n=1 Tax=Ramlibacter tataouinensis TaxID=94132 RepID=A0A127K0I4_9BURK|nr:hypothetical protein UC35_15075 [Ramlibacter tataouinensis]